MNRDDRPFHRDLSRRTVTRAIAWTIPVIALSAPAPAFAARDNPSVSASSAERTKQCMRDAGVLVHSLHKFVR